MAITRGGTQPADDGRLPGAPLLPTEGRHMDTSNGARPSGVLRCTALGDRLMATPALAVLCADAKVTLPPRARHVPAPIPVGRPA